MKEDFGSEQDFITWWHDGFSFLTENDAWKVYKSTKHLEHNIKEKTKKECIKVISNNLTAIISSFIEKTLTSKNNEPLTTKPILDGIKRVIRSI